MFLCNLSLFLLVEMGKDFSLFSLLVNGIPQILLEPFGLGVDADLTVAVLELGTEDERERG